MRELASWPTQRADCRYNIKNPAGDYLAKESNVEVVRQISQLKVKRRKESTEAERQRLIAEGQELPEVS